MKTLTKTVLTLASVTVVSLALAQSPGVTEKEHKAQDKGHVRMQKIIEVQKTVLEEIGVTARQAKKIEALNQTRIEKAKKKAQEISEKGVPQNLDRKEIAGKLKKVHEEYNAQIKEILGNEKFEQYKGLMKERIKALRKDRKHRSDDK